MGVFKCTSKKTYLHLHHSGSIGKALLSMCVLVIKQDKQQGVVCCVMPGLQGYLAVPSTTVAFVFDEAYGFLIASE